MSEWRQDSDYHLWRNTQGGGEESMTAEYANALEAEVERLRGERDRIQHETIVAGMLEFSAERDRRITAEQSAAELRAAIEHEAHNTQAQSDIAAEYYAETLALKTQVETLTAALQPFADHISEDVLAKTDDPSAPVLIGFGHRLLTSHFIRARAALASLQAQDQQQEQEEGS